MTTRDGRTDRRLGHADWLARGAWAQVVAVLDRDGEEARVVGGAVRNALLGLPHGDIDVATTALPDDVIRRAQAAGFKVAPTGIEHGTVTVVVDEIPVEVTTLRQDVETFGRKAIVRFGRDWRADAERRDFTMNALSASHDGVVYDYVGGLADLDARRVRFIGDPGRRIAEDYLRILRFFRFHAAYGHGAPDPAGLLACIMGRAGLAHLSRERVRMELMKLLVTPAAAPTLAVMADAGLLLLVFAGVPQVKHVAAMALAEEACGLVPDPLRRLGALAVLISEDAERLWQRLRLTNAEHERLLSMADGWWRIAPHADDMGARALLYRLGPQHFTDRVLLAWARSAAGPDTAWADLAMLPEQWTAPAFPLKAADLMARGVPKGPALGAALRAAEDAWIMAGFPIDAPALAAIAASAARRAPD
ncbi:MAG: CCA tRNA nucleotidyltransferase [Xanthobacteraceae bacterium]